MRGKYRPDGPQQATAGQCRVIVYGPGEIPEMFSTASCGYCVPEPLKDPPERSSLPDLPPSFSEVDRGRVLGGVHEALAEDLEGGEIDLSECYIDATFVIAKRGRVSERPSGVKVRNSCAFRGLFCSSSPPHRECFTA